MRLASVQLLRGAAAFAVLMSHLRVIEREVIKLNGGTETGLYEHFWDNGFAGVDLFFVISGFIMVYVTFGRERGLTSAGDFLFARASRIYPLWWLFAALMALAFLLTQGTPYAPEPLARAGNGPVLYLINSFFLLPQGGLPVLGVGWTLVHEMYFYAVFALFLLAPARWLPLLLLGWAAYVIGMDAVGLSQPYAVDFLALSTYPMTMEFIGGAAAALLLIKGVRVFPLAATILGAAGFLLAMHVFENTSAEYTLRWGRVLWFGLPSILLVYGLTALEAERRLTAPKWWVTVGDISFSLYLGHVIVITVVKRAFAIIAETLSAMGAPEVLSGLFRLGTPGPLDNILFGLVGLIASLIAAWIVFNLFERPSLSWLNGRRKALFPPVRSAAADLTKPSRIW